MERFNLTWPSYFNHLKGMFSDLYTQAKFTDVTLVCDDQSQLKAHKAMLSACSPVFRSILESHQQIHPVIFLRGIQYLEMELILKFMYFGETTVFTERVEEFLKVAKDLEMEKLCDIYQNVNQIDKGEVENTDEMEFTVENDDTLDHTATLSETVSEEKDASLTIPCEPILPRVKMNARKVSLRKPLSHTLEKRDTETVRDSGSVWSFCVRCGAKYREITVRGNQTLLYSCDLCDEKFHQLWKLTKHFYHYHQKIKRHCRRGYCLPK